MKRFAGAFLAILLILSSVLAVAAAEEAHYLAKISNITALYDERLGRVELYFETAGTLYHEQGFSLTVTCTAYEDGEWKTGKLIRSALYCFDGCVPRENVVECTLELSAELYENSLYKDFCVTVEGQRVDMGDMITGAYYSLDTVTVPITAKRHLEGETLSLATEVSSKRVALGGEFTYKVYPVSISKNLSGGLNNFSFTLNYDPAVMRLEGVTCMAPRGSDWHIEDYGFAPDGYRVCLSGKGVTDDGDVIVVFRFVSLAPTDTTELYVLDVQGGDGYGHSYTAVEWALCEAKPVIKETETGDLNADGCIDSLDASFILKYDAGILSNVAPSGDVNGDGYVDSLDASVVLKYDAGILDSL